MEKSNLKISIIIIGFNTAKELKSLLDSICVLKQKQNILEIVYIDDASSDNSYEIFKTHSMPFTKKGKQLAVNSGRSFATQKGVDLSSGDWLLFVRSNEIVSKNLIIEFLKSMKISKALAYMGVVKYFSSDKAFVKYLNNSKRGVAQFASGEPIHYKYLLFNNSIIHKRIFKKVKLDPSLSCYGGEELAFAYELNSFFPNKICAAPHAVVFRYNYPNLLAHCCRLYEFGNTNFKKLHRTLQLDVVRFHFLLNNNFLLKIFNDMVYLFCCVLRFLRLGHCFWLTRLHFLSAILRGYYRPS